MSAGNPYQQETLPCGCVLERSAVNLGMWTVAEKTRPCKLHVLLQWLQPHVVERAPS